jgi:glucuronokinase
MVTVSVPARAGLAGNPSDGYGGATLAVPVPSLTATVAVDAAPRVSIHGPRSQRSWRSAAEAVEHADRYGYDDGDRLVHAAVVVLTRAIDDIPEGGFRLRWRTTIPRSVGLGGSSALVVATIRALSAHWTLELAPIDVARLALAAELDELGIAAGWQDRLVQAHGQAVLVDASSNPPTAQPLRMADGVELFVAWDERGAAPSGELHAALRARFEAGDGDVRSAMSELAGCATKAAVAFEVGDRFGLAAAVEQTCRLRARIGALSEPTRRLLDAARSVGVAATSAGSGGAIAGVLPPRRARNLRATLRDVGASVLRVQGTSSTPPS